MSGLTVGWLVTQIMPCTVKSFCFTYHPCILVTGATVSADNKPHRQWEALQFKASDQLKLRTI
uniref:Uncharacterized protein n=1 Tax=Glossina palpalis gambiensis TaxID=67801 RepID=A0A1B0AW52_9MUSC